MVYSQSNKGHIRPDLKVGKLARLAITEYLKIGSPEEVARLQNGEYCHNTFILNGTMPVLVPVDVIENAPAGSHVGEAGFYHAHYWTQEVEFAGVRYRMVNDWKEPPNPRDNRTPLEDWIRVQGLDL